MFSAYVPAAIWGILTCILWFNRTDKAGIAGLNDDVVVDNNDDDSNLCLDHFGAKGSN